MDTEEESRNPMWDQGITSHQGSSSSSLVLPLSNSPSMLHKKHLRLFGTTVNILKNTSCTPEETNHMRNVVLRTGRDESTCTGLKGALLEELFEDGGLTGADASSNNDATVLLRVLTTQLLHNNKGQLTLLESDSECKVFLQTMPHLFYLAVDPLPSDEHGDGLGVGNLKVNQHQVQL